VSREPSLKLVTFPAGVWSADASLAGRIREIIRATPLELRAATVHVLATANHPK
jgi:hypothetical protein